MSEIHTYISNKKILKILLNFENNIKTEDFQLVFQSDDIQERFIKLLNYYGRNNSENQFNKLPEYPNGNEVEINDDWIQYIKDICKCCNIDVLHANYLFRLYLKNWKLPNREFNKDDWNDNFLFEIYYLYCQEKIDLFKSLLNISYIRVKEENQFPPQFSEYYSILCNFYDGLINEDFINTIISMIKYYFIYLEIFINLHLILIK